MNCISLKEQKGENEMRRGFTLIELMIVISVMAILIGIALPYFKGMQDEGNSAKCAGELRTLATAIESYNIHNNAYPDTASAGTVDIEWQAAITAAKPTIVKIILLDPFDASAPVGEYQYSTSASTSLYYVVLSVGPDGTAQITGMDVSGNIEPTGAGALGDDIYISNGPDGNSF
jgi:general secretion pathway protein G